MPWLAAAIGAGGIAGPILLMTGDWPEPMPLRLVLLLTLEGAATALMAWFIFHENFNRRVALGMICLVAGAADARMVRPRRRWPAVIGPTAIIWRMRDVGLSTTI
jgi:hypothetical protein